MCVSMVYVCTYVNTTQKLVYIHPLFIFWYNRHQILSLNFFFYVINSPSLVFIEQFPFLFYRTFSNKSSIFSYFLIFYFKWNVNYNYDNKVNVCVCVCVLFIMFNEKRKLRQCNDDDQEGVCFFLLLCSELRSKKNVKRKKVN